MVAVLHNVNILIHISYADNLSLAIHYIGREMNDFLQKPDLCLDYIVRICITVINMGCLLNVLRPPFCTLTTHSWLNWVGYLQWGKYGSIHAYVGLDVPTQPAQRTLTE